MVYENLPCRRPKISRQDREIIKRLQKSNSPLREKYMEDLDFHKFSRLTREKYIDALLRVTAHFWKPPEKLTDEDLRSYFIPQCNH